MNLTVLGCGDAFGNGGRNNTSFLLTGSQSERVLIDCGASTLIRLKYEKIDLESISTIIITHFNGDHFGGIPFFLISSMFESLRNNPLTIVGPIGVQQRVLELQEAMYRGTSERMQDLKIEFVEYRSDMEVVFGDKKITAFAVDHSPKSSPHGVRLTWEGKIFAFSGDTSWTNNLIHLAEKSDVFICECNFLTDSQFGHISFEEISNYRHKLNCKQLWLTHMNDEVIEATDTKMNKLHDGMKLDF